MHLGSLTLTSPPCLYLQAYIATLIFSHTLEPCCCSVGSMDSAPLPSQKPIKRLSDLLQEQQEPFSLDVYLVERGYLKKKPKPTSSSGSKRRKRTTAYPKILKTVLNKLLPNTDVLKIPSCRDGKAIQDRKFHVSAKGGGTSPHVVELNRFSSASTMTVYDSSSESDIEQEFPSPQNQIPSSCSEFCNNLRDQATFTADRTQQCGCLEDSKQHSPVSVLEELPTDEVSPFHHHMICCSRSKKNEIPSASSIINQTKRVTEESILSASLWDLLHLSEKQGNVGVKELRKLLETSNSSSSSSSSSSSQYRKTKRVLEQTKQLLFDCVREVLETNEQRTIVLGAEHIGKMICEQICSWAKQSANLTNIRQLIISGFWDSVEEEWNDFQPQPREIGIEISNVILEEIENEIVADIVDCFSK